ncbi:MAG: BREX system P-loop protein BrxC [Candidatus Izemoplasmataceae bacterium]
MYIKDIFNKPIDRNIQGVVTIGNEKDDQRIQELDEYVCTKEITNTFRTFFKRYRASIQTPTEKMGVWITGFFGSGKSHFIKILGYILENKEIGGKKAINYFDDKIQDSIVLADMKQSAQVENKVVLFNIDSKARSDSKSKSQAIMDIMLRAFNEAVGLCATTPWVADLERELITDDLYDAYKKSFKSISNKDWHVGRNQALLNRDSIIQALINVKGITLESARKYVDDQTINYTKTTEGFAKIVNNYCTKYKTRVIFLMDEVGQFIGSNGELMLNLQTCVEDLGKYCHGQAWVVVTSQQELKAMIDSNTNQKNDFSKIQGRFDTRLLLSGSNADEVIKKRILDKKETAVTSIESLYDTYKSKLNNLIIFSAKPTWSGYKDANEFKDVYPFVSYQFELLQKVFESIREHGMSEGRHLSQNERSLLSAFQESAKKYQSNEMGILAPFDSFYSTIEQFIDYDVKTVFTNAQKRTTLDEFDIRLLQVLFMIKHVKEMPATIDRLATLMVQSVNEDKLVLKENISKALKSLEDETLIQKNGDEYDFLTNEEQSVNRQINNTSFSEGDVIRTVGSIIYESILDTNKFRYKSRYDFTLNRFVDNDSKGSYNPDNITIKVVTNYNDSDLSDETAFLSESMKMNGIIIDLREGTYIEELIRASKIDTFKRNNSATMSSTLAEIMDKKTREAAERRKRAENDIRARLRTAQIYANSSRLNIKEKDGKDRINEAIELQVQSKFYKLGLVTFFYDSANAILAAINENTAGPLLGNIEDDANYEAYKEIIEKLKSDKMYHRRTTVKQIVEFCTKSPFGWRDTDTRGIIATLWKYNMIKISVHDSIVPLNNANFKYDIARGNSLDTMVVSLYERIDEAILNEVKKAMKEAFDETYNIEEETLKNDVLAFFNAKKKVLGDINTKYGPSSYPGSSLVKEIYSLFDKITSSNDNAIIFNSILEKKTLLINHATNLEKIESFYRSNSAQMKNYEEAKAIYDWYYQNQMLEDLSNLTEVVESIHSILKLQIPFDKMSDLATLVFKAKTIQDKMHEEKINTVTSSLNKDLVELAHEAEEALKLDLDETQKNEISSTYEEIKAKYNSWFESIKTGSNNLDSYTFASQRELKGFKDYIFSVINKKQSEPTSVIKRIKIINYVPVANKKVTSIADVDKVIDEIREKLVRALDEADELDLE